MKTTVSSFIRKALAVLILLFLAVSISGCGREETPERAVISGLSDLEDKRIGATTGSIQALQVEERFPDAQLFYFSTSVDMLNALRSNKIDAYADGESLVRYMMAANPDLTYLDEKLSDGMDIGAVFPKTEEGRKLCDEYSAFVREIRENGVWDEIRETWFGDDDWKRAPADLDALPGPNGTLRLAADLTLVPYVFVMDGEPAGFDIDLVCRFCEDHGYALELVPMDFSGIITNSVNSWLKTFASRPRYKYLLKLDDPRSEFRQWWQMVPQLSSSDNFKS